MYIYCMYLCVWGGTYRLWTILDYEMSLDLSSYLDYLSSILLYARFCRRVFIAERFLSMTYWLFSCHKINATGPTNYLAIRNMLAFTDKYTSWLIRIKNLTTYLVIYFNFYLFRDYTNKRTWLHFYTLISKTHYLPSGQSGNKSQIFLKITYKRYEWLSYV